MEKLLATIEKYVLYLTVFLMPLAFLPIFPNPFETPKLILLVAGVGLALLLRAARGLFSNEGFEIRVGNFDPAVALILVAYLLSGILRTPNKMEAFFLPGTATLFIAGSLLYFLLNQLSGDQKRTLSLLLFLSGLTTSLLYLLVLTGILAKIPQLPPYVKDASFTPVGAIFPLALFLVTILPLSISLVLSEGHFVQKTFLAVATLIILFGLGLSSVNLLPGKPFSPTLPDWPTSWAIAVESIKESPLLGEGPGNYLTAFSRFLPISYNQTPLWAARFTTGSNFFLTSLAEVGLLGLVSFGLLLASILRKTQEPAKDLGQMGALASLVVLLILLAALPGATIIIIILFILLSLSSQTQKVNLGTGLLRTIGVVIIILLALLAFQAARVLDAELTFKGALDALAANDGLKTYKLMGQAVNKNPQVDRYHAAYAQVNLILARNLAQGKTLSDQDKQTISQLIQQAISEGKATVALNPQRSGNWEFLARIYQAIMPLATGADQFTIQTMSQAVALDPTNPNLRIALGGIYYALGRYDEAIDAFKLATLAKADLANAHYNLSAAFREKGEIDKAIAEMKIVLTLVQKGSNDEKTAKAELDNLEKRKATKGTAASESLTPPTKATTLIKPPLELPKEATPPAQP